MSSPSCVHDFMLFKTFFIVRCTVLRGSPDFESVACVQNDGVSKSLTGQTILPTQANSIQAFSLDEVGYRLAFHLARVGWVGSGWHEPIKLKFSLNSSKVFHRLATSANSSQVILLFLGDCPVVVRELNGFLASWLDLAEPFGHPPMQVLNFARVGTLAYYEPCPIKS